jgi:hypothetical protein
MTGRPLQKKVRAIGHTDLNGHPNGGQVVVQRRGRKYYAFVGHMRGMGTSIVDVTKPNRPEVITQIPSPPGTHTHKVRVSGDTMLVNNEKFHESRLQSSTFEPGLRIFDVKDLSAPKELSFFRTSGSGVHRFSVDNEKHLAYIPTCVDGYLDHIFMTVDFSSPDKPREICRWWLNGQWLAGGEKPTWPENRRYGLHLPIVHEDRAYLAYWDAGFMILDFKDITHPKLISKANYCPPYGGATHTALPVAREICGRKWMIVFDECLEPDLDPPGDSRMWMVDVTDERNPVSVATFCVPEETGLRRPNARFGPHQPFEDVKLKNDLVFATWFSGGLRVVSVENPHLPTEVGYFVPPRIKGKRPIQTNDVFIDDRELIYLIDRWDRGLDIVEYNG